MVLGDPALISIALSNVLKNAVEAVQASPDGSQPGIVLTWGTTIDESWITVMDEGPGFPYGTARLTDPGISSKSKDSEHLGMGLAIANTALESLGGRLLLSSRRTRGASCELRWPSERAVS